MYVNLVGEGLRRTSSVPDQRMVEKRPDPVREVCDILVKIADLGNACWVVSNTLLTSLVTVIAPMKLWDGSCISSYLVFNKNMVIMIFIIYDHVLFNMKFWMPPVNAYNETRALSCI